VAIWYGVSRIREDVVEVDKQLVFEEKIATGFEVLNLRT
jgi:hypothetical protein